MRLTMVGTGYVGLVTGVCFSNTGNDVTCLDVDPKKIEKLKKGVCPIYEPGLTELMEKNFKAGSLDVHAGQEGSVHERGHDFYLCGDA
jgi:UDPglucose 6-dehydrogenase